MSEEIKAETEPKEVIRGFYTEKYDNGVEVETLMTGDGKARFTDIQFDDGSASIGISYGQGKGIGAEEQHDEKINDEMQIKWQVKFDNQISVDSMIKALLRVKNYLAK